MTEPIDNLFTGLPARAPRELVDLLLESSGVRIERIVSTGHCSPAGCWYDQEEAEWVVVLRGEATLSFADEQPPLRLQPGDFANIAPRRRHRVERTSPEEPTVWLAVFYRPD